MFPETEHCTMFTDSSLALCVPTDTCILKTYIHYRYTSSFTLITSKGSKSWIHYALVTCSKTWKVSEHGKFRIIRKTSYKSPPTLHGHHHYPPPRGHFQTKQSVNHVLRWAANLLFWRWPVPLSQSACSMLSQCLTGFYLLVDVDVFPEKLINIYISKFERL